MKFACLKVRESGNNRLAVTERGSFFGYGDLVVDMRGIPIMKKECECPVIMDITHSLQQPNGADGVSGGLPDSSRLLQNPDWRQEPTAYSWRHTGIR